MTNVSYEGSRSHYAEGVEFRVSTVQLLTATGTYIEAPDQRYRGEAVASVVLIALGLRANSQTRHHTGSLSPGTWSTHSVSCFADMTVEQILSRLTVGTRVTFPGGATTGTSTIVLVVPGYKESSALVLTEETPFHPVSHSWPDQEGDRGSLTVGKATLPVVDTLTVATTTDGIRALYVDSEIPVRKVVSGWTFFVAHVVPIADPASIDVVEGRPVALAVDADRRRALSASHTATHVAALAMNKVCAHMWRKVAGTDALGNPDLDRLAMERSTISVSGATDTYRFGKSLRKSGFSTDQFCGEVDSVSAMVNQQVNEWLRSRARVAIEVAGPTLDAARTWTCELDGRVAKFPCGGTHVVGLDDLASVSVTYEISDDAHEVVMRTVPTRQDGSTPLR